MADDGECLVSEAFTESEAETDDEQIQTVVTMEDLDSPPGALSEAQRSALQTTLGVASTAANLVLLPYVVAGKAAVQATTMAVSAPIHITNHVRASIAQSWGRADHGHEHKEDADLFGEHTSSTSDLSSSSSGNEQVMEVFPAEDKEPATAETAEHQSGVVSQLLFLPVRLVHSGVSSAVAIPTRVATYSGRKISGAVSTSHALATSAVVATTGVVARTGMHVARGITHGAVSTASFTASTISGAVGASVRTVSYVIPPSVSNAVWQGMDVTGNASVSVLSHAIAVPSYRMLKALVPAVQQCFSEEDAVNETRAAVKMLVKLLGPQNAFYLLKWAYETVNSEEVHDGFLLCRDVLHESMDKENYRHAGESVGAATGITKVVHVMKEAYSVLPSFDELLDAAALVADVSDEVADGVSHAVTGKGPSDAGDSEGEDDSPRFELVEAEEEASTHSPVVLAEETFERERSSSSSSDEELNPFLTSLTRVCDSEEAASLFNAFGDFLDVLVD
ncbi:hypothetical protein PHYSODRAFT_505836 [Phytophthora sojae]|uniref:Uncharacterized protein n=1 Tax=Phytophthora sojae (strain P6497) TaxID=1094619 RepID=G4ZQL1_PHYSP|nr:hypothetical protein PHYSODRAFT_505836 [Phytophthora sojae]EGZ15868.1 hypothetical protein PHYSODRAFT_505836 [Phytophthora sojae]|eukprot:XP_009529617.1 hypothetical protein PHYSODRAFT_505836 [Phytophthora sojae]